MSARLITKCPGCDAVTSDCTDSTLTKDRTEYDGKCCAKPQPRIAPHKALTSAQAIGRELRKGGDR